MIVNKIKENLKVVLVKESWLLFKSFTDKLKSFDDYRYVGVFLCRHSKFEDEELICRDVLID